MAHNILSWENHDLKEYKLDQDLVPTIPTQILTGNHLQWWRVEEIVSWMQIKTVALQGQVIIKFHESHL